MSILINFIYDDAGATAIEYGLIAALVAIVCVIAFTATGDTINDSFANISKDLCDAVGGTFSLTASGTDSCTFS